MHRIHSLARTCASAIPCLIAAVMCLILGLSPASASAEPSGSGAAPVPLVCPHGQAIEASHCVTPDKTTDHDIDHDAEPDDDYAPEGASSTASANGPAQYHGGEVLNDPVVHLVFWAPTGYSYESGFESALEAYLSDASASAGVGAPNAFGVASEYSDADGPALQTLTDAGASTDTDPFPGSGCPVPSGDQVCLTDDQVFAEVSAIRTADNVPATMNQTIALILPAGVAQCSDATASSCATSAYCGFHYGETSGGSQGTTAIMIPYPQEIGNGGCEVGGGPNDPIIDAAETDLQHEIIEDATDPAGGGYYAGSASGGELEDICAYVWGTESDSANGGGYNQTYDGDPFQVQETYDDQTSACAQAPTAKISASISQSSGPIMSGEAATYTASLDGDANSASSYSWAYANQADPWDYETVSGSGDQATIQFTQPGTYTVWSTVLDSAGATVTAVGQTTVLAAPSANFVFSSVSGTTATVNASASVSPNGPITSWDWNWGDGTTSGGEHASHAYGQPGTYMVTLTVQDSAGASASHQEEVTIAAPSPGLPTTIARPSHVTRLTKSHGHWKLAVTLEHYPRGRVAITVAAGGHSYVFRYSIGGSGNLDAWFTDTIKMRLVSIRGLS